MPIKWLAIECIRKKVTYFLFCLLFWQFESEKYIFFNSKFETCIKKEVLDYDNAGWIFKVYHFGVAFQDNSTFKLSVSLTIFAPKINPFLQKKPRKVFINWKLYWVFCKGGTWQLNLKVVLLVVINYYCWVRNVYRLWNDSASLENYYL